MNVKMLKPIFSIILALLFSSAVNATPMQWEIADGGNDHWYEFVTLRTNEFDARSNALTSSYNGEYGYLATILSQGEQNFIKALTGNTRAWIGASDSITEGTWVWMDGPESGQVLSYSFWARNEPNDHARGEDYASINWTSDGRWNDWGTPSYRVSIGSIVEYNNSVNIPEPTTIAIFALGLIGLASRRSMLVSKK